MTDNFNQEINSLHILVAEDNVINQMVVVKLLEKLGHSSAVASTGLECIDMLSKDRYDLILMDCMMPELDGLETARRIRASHSHCSGIPIIALSANDKELDCLSCLEAGMDEYMQKPITIEQMTTLLSEWSARIKMRETK